MDNLPLVVICLSTYNGSAYLDEQLNSLLNQSYENIKILVRDDGSTDNTCDILRRYVRDNKSITMTLDRNVGVVTSFAKLLDMVPSEAQYVAFCDQDDVWLPDKLEHTLSVLEKGEKRYGIDVPLLVHTDLYVVDKHGKLLNSSFMQLRHLRHEDQNPLRTLLVQNFVTGCTIVMNRALVEKCLPFPDAILMHDWWVALIAASIGKILFIPTPTINYRQHETNVAGAKGFIRLENLLKFFDKQKKNQELVACIKQGIVLEQHLVNIYGNSHSYENQTNDLLKIFEAISNKGGLSALRKALSKKIYKQGLMRNLAFYWILLRGKYVQKQ